jgi:hypothetical protein
MKFPLLIYGSPVPAALEALGAKYMAFSQQIIDSGEMVGGDPFEGVHTAKVVRVRDGNPLIDDGPMSATAEALNGYYVVDVKDLHRAVELASKIPDARTGGVEVRAIAAIPA